MTISSNNSPLVYNGNGVTTVFAYTFTILDDDEIKVQKKVTSTGVITTLIKTTDYTVSGVGVAAGGNVTLVDAATDAPTGSTIILSSNADLVQETDYNEYDSFPASSHETALDRLTIISQQINAKVLRSFQVDLGVTTAGFDPIVPTPVASQLLAVTSAGTGLEWVSGADASIYSFPSSGTGLLIQSAANTAIVRTLTGTAAEITVTNGTGVSGNPTLSLPSALTFTGKTITGGTYSAPVLSGSVTGTYTLAGTPTITSPAISSPTMSGTVALGSSTVTGSVTASGLTLTSPIFVTPALGTPASGVLTSCTGYTVANLAGAAAGVLTFLATPSSANLISAVTDETGTGALVFANTPTLVTPVLGVATGTSFNTITGVATQAEQETGSSIVQTVTPGRQQYHPSAAKAWVTITYSGGVPAAELSYNVTSLTDSNTGDGLINFTTAFSGTTYGGAAANRTAAGLFGIYLFPSTSSALRWVTATDQDMFVCCFGDQ